MTRLQLPRSGFVPWKLSDLTAPSSVLKWAESGGVTGIAVSREARWMAATNRSGSVRLWRLAKSDERSFDMRVGADGQARSFASFSPDDHWLAVGAGDRASLVDLSQSDPSGAITAISGHSPTFSDDGRWLFTVQGDEVRIWDLEDPAVQNSVVRLKGSKGEKVSSVYGVEEGQDRWLTARTNTFDPLTSTYRQRTFRWPLSQDTILSVAQRAIGRNLSLKEWTKYFPRKTYRKTFADLPPPPEE